MNIQLFKELRNQYIQTGFSNQRIELELSSMMAKDPTHIPTRNEDNTSPVGWIALRPARYHFGFIRRHEVVQVCDITHKYILTSFPSEPLCSWELQASVEHVEVWLPLYSEAELRLALENWEYTHVDERRNRHLALQEA